MLRVQVARLLPFDGAMKTCFFFPFLFHLLNDYITISGAVFLNAVYLLANP